MILGQAFFPNDDPDMPQHFAEFMRQMHEQAEREAQAVGEAEQTCIDGEQKELHVVAETIAVFAVTPFMFWLSGQKALPEWARATSFLVGAGTLLVDGYLLLKYAAR